MAASRRVSYEQLEVLWEFLNTHRDIAMGYNKSLQAREMSRRFWTEIAQNLNSIVGGPVKDSKGWAAYWVDYKGKIKRKCAAIRLSQVRTGRGPSENLFLSDIERKYLLILGEDYGVGLPGIQVDPLNTHSTNAPSTSSQVSQSIMKNLPAIMVPTEAQEIVVNRLSPSDFAQEIFTEQQATTSTCPTTQPAAAPAAEEGTSRSRRQRRRPTRISLEDARRALVESGRIRAEATQNINESLKCILNVLTQIAATLERQVNR